MVRYWAGCSGWSYSDWVGTFYPPSTRDHLSFYSSVFNTVEVDSTFYRQPSGISVDRWIRTVSGREFMFSVKAPRAVTHEALFRSAELASASLAVFEDEVLERFRSKGVLGYCLIQLPPAFGPGNMESLIGLLGEARTGRYRYAVEFRNRALYSREYYSRLVEVGVLPVTLDSPESRISGVNELSGQAYVRLHGRNYEAWYRKSDALPFDYEYSDSELESIVGIIRGSSGLEEVFIYFNNHPSGKAPRNAIRAMDMLGITRNLGRIV
ncbi:hypothetical protein GCM10007108_00380 [Thermogymnomonas acidicola]|uniref:DUF72 domain-containing protein n=1 Tax=Thermogymnomonas acidicola TaxID=399579 RepID=A0AA37BQA0_9ARCH|nr:DUF72 domain-containing protein [Thermogymnomonas acidicola]GGM66029.1 hypothetical protein GCM10007108_00380 [Thermogymnomonas acidicola]